MIGHFPRGNSPDETRDPTLDPPNQTNPITGEVREQLDDDLLEEASASVSGNLRQIKWMEGRSRPPGLPTESQPVDKEWVLTATGLQRRCETTEDPENPGQLAHAFPQGDTPEPPKHLHTDPKGKGKACAGEPLMNIHSDPKGKGKAREEEPIDTDGPAWETDTASLLSNTSATWQPRTSLYTHPDESTHDLEISRRMWREEQEASIDSNDAGPSGLTGRRYEPEPELRDDDPTQLLLEPREDSEESIASDPDRSYPWLLVIALLIFFGGILVYFMARRFSKLGR